jgi:hypothetical protein
MESNTVHRNDTMSLPLLYPEHVWSRLILEAKQGQTWLVLGWEKYWIPRLGHMKNTTATVHWRWILTSLSAFSLCKVPATLRLSWCKDVQSNPCRDHMQGPETTRTQIQLLEACPISSQPLDCNHPRDPKARISELREFLTLRVHEN